MAEVKPKLRGWMHLSIAPLTLAGGIVLIALSPTTMTRIGSTAFSLSALALFTVSAIYHTGTWSPRTWAFLRRFDHANIFVLIAGSYTPLTLILLQGTQRTALLVTVWTCAVLGVLFRVFWTDAPRWLYTPIYIAMGWAAVFFIPGFIDGASSRLGTGMGAAVLILVAIGGAPLHHRRRRLRLQAAQPVAARTSASTRCSTASRSSPSSPTTSGCRWRRTPCAEAQDARVRSLLGERVPPTVQHRHQ